MASKVKHFYARAKQTRERIPAMTREECLATAADVRNAANVAAFMGDDEAASDFLHELADDLIKAAKDKEARDAKAKA
jgi:hypothetical protein